MGVFLKDTFSGDFVDGWTGALEQSKLKKVNNISHNICLHVCVVVYV